MKRFWIALVAGLVVGGFIAEDVAAASSVSKKRTFGLRKEGRGHVQMKSMIAPVKKTKRSRRTYNTSVTVVLTIRDNFKVGKVCKKGPRIADALLQAWYRNPIPRDYLYERKARSGETRVDYRRTPEQRKIDKKLIRIINKTIGMKGEVTGILVIKGTVKSGGGSIMKLPFSSVNGCDELEEEEDPKKKKKK